MRRKESLTFFAVLRSLFFALPLLVLALPPALTISVIVTNSFLADRDRRRFSPPEIIPSRGAETGQRERLIV